MLEDRTPTLILMEHLIRDGWERGPAPEQHTQDSPRVLGLDRFSARKHFFQCLLSLDALRARGLSALPSGRSSWYYRAVLAAARPADINPSLPVRQLKALLAGTAHGEGGQPRPAVADIAPEAGPDRGSESGSDSSDAFVLSAPPAAAREDEDEHLPEPDSTLPLPPSLPSSSSTGQPAVLPRASAAGSPRSAASSSSSSSASSEDPDAPHELLLGAPLRRPAFDCIKVEEKHTPGQFGYYRRCTTTCPLSRTGHWSVVPCGKRRNCGVAQQGRLGLAAPEAFLLVWRANASRFPSKAAHQRWSPTEAEVRRFMVEQGWL